MLLNWEEILISFGFQDAHSSFMNFWEASKLSILWLLKSSKHWLVFQLTLNESFCVVILSSCSLTESELRLALSSHDEWLSVSVQSCRLALFILSTLLFVLLRSLLWNILNCSLIRRCCTDSGSSLEASGVIDLWAVILLLVEESRLATLELNIVLVFSLII
jgi:hypothetical protein